jgi:hypothetical protein
MLDADLAALRERVRYARTFKPIELPAEPAVETDDEDEAGQCLRHAAAAVLRVPQRSLPRVPEGDDRFDRWTDAMRRLGHVFEDLPLDEIPPANQQPWVAIVDAPGDATHALGCVGLTVLRDERDGREPWQTISPAQVLSAFRFAVAA